MQTSVSMSRAIHEAIYFWLFQDLIYCLKKTCGNFGVLGITRLLDIFARVLIQGDGKQIRVQFCCETFLLRHLLTLKHSHHFDFCLEFHDHFLLCSDGFTLIKLDYLPVTISSSLFSSYCIWSFTHLFPHFWPIYLFQTSISLSVAWLCKFLIALSLPVHLTHRVYLDFLTVDPCIFAAYSSLSP